MKKSLNATFMVKSLDGKSGVERLNEGMSKFGQNIRTTL